MVIEASILTTILKDPISKAFGWTLDEAKKGTNEQKIKKSISTLAEKITNVVKVKTIYKGDESIDLYDFYIPTRVDNVSSRIEHISHIDAHSIVLEGTVGQGKSIFMRYLTYQEAQQRQRIPIFFELRRLEENQSLEEAIYTTIKNWIPLFNREYFAKVAESGSLVLFLDGFDEVPREKLKSLLNEIEGWCERYPEMQLVISARPESEIQKSNFFKVYELSNYRFYEQCKLINKLVAEEESNKILKQAISDSTVEIKELLKTPLMVTLFVMKYRASLEIPENPGEFYQELFSVLISRHDKTKPGFKRQLNSNLSETQLQEVFEEFCYLTGNKRKLVFSHVEAVEIIETCLSKKKFQPNPIDVLEDFSKVVCLLLKDGLDYSFIHRSIQEYFYANFILKKPERAKEKFFFEYSKNGYMYFQISGAIYFIEKGDLYSYYKYFKLPVIVEYIHCYQMTRTNNNLVEHLYVDNIIEEEIVISLDDKNEIKSGFFCAPKDIYELSTYISELISGGSFNFHSVTYGRKDIENIKRNSSTMGCYKNLKECLSKENLKQMESKAIEISNELLDLREEIEEYINQEDSINMNINFSDFE